MAQVSGPLSAGEGGLSAKPTRLRAAIVQNASAEALARGAYFVATILFAWRLGAEQFGLLGTAQGIAMILLPLADAGLAIHGTREGAGARAAERVTLIADITFARFALALVVMLVFAGVVLATAPGSAGVYLAAALYIPASALYPDWLARGIGKFGYIVRANAVQAVVLLSLAVILVRAPDDTAAAALVRPVATVCGALALYGVLRLSPIRLLRNARPQMAVDHLRKSMRIGMSTWILSITMYGATPLTALLTDAATAGHFEAALRLYLLPTLAALVVQSTFFPRFAKLHSEARRIDLHRLHARYQMVMGAGSVVLLVLAFTASQRIVATLYPGDFAPAADVLAILLVTAAVDLVRYTYGSVLIAAGFSSAHLHASRWTLAVGATASLILIPAYGATGTALSLLVSGCVNLSLLAVHFRRKLPA